MSNGSANSATAQKAMMCITKGLTSAHLAVSNRHNPAATVAEGHAVMLRKTAFEALKGFVRVAKWKLDHCLIACNWPYSSCLFRLVHSGLQEGNIPGYIVNQPQLEEMVCECLKPRSGCMQSEETKPSLQGLAGQACFHKLQLV